jgi:demethylmenaquinone methyltransferase/2-methoxy-6-polyprenyl-1,4-benzoquinol methylase
VAHSISERNRLALELFAPLATTYDRYASLLSFGQDPRWRRYLVSRLDARPGERVLDVACGTGAVSVEIARRYGCTVVAADQSPEMLAEGRVRIERAGLGDRIELVEARAEALPFPDGDFDHLTFTYLLRYVDDPAATLHELARAVRPGGRIAMLEFLVPPREPWHALWEAYVRVGLPLLGRAAGTGWHEVGSFLGPSIRTFYDRWPPERLLGLWREAGIVDVEHRVLSVGGGIVVWGRRGD